MADRRKRFTEQMIDRLRPPKSGRDELSDSLMPGLILRVTDRGTKTFSVVYKVAGEGDASESGEVADLKAREGKARPRTASASFPSCSRRP